MVTTVVGVGVVLVQGTKVVQDDNLSELYLLINQSINQLVRPPLYLV